MAALLFRFHAVQQVLDVLDADDDLVAELDTCGLFDGQDELHVAQRIPVFQRFRRGFRRDGPGRHAHDAGNDLDYFFVHTGQPRNTDILVFFNPSPAGCGRAWTQASRGPLTDAETP